MVRRIRGEPARTAVPGGDERRQREPVFEADRQGRRLTGFARAAPRLIGSAASFGALCAATLVWLALGPGFGFSSDWLLVPSAGPAVLGRPPPLPPSLSPEPGPHA